jgi:ABC-type transport system involved in cytochrome bd biosynthesis fused ATPase/permease subunit
MNDPMATVPATPSNTSHPTITPTPLSDRSGVTDGVRAQILATEHWSLLASRSMTWNEVFSRASMFITVLSAAVVALALVAQATAFGSAFRLFALLVLPVVLLLGLATLIRLSDANSDDFWMMIGMNRLRHAYLELAPELEPYFVTGRYDDENSVMQSYGYNARFRFSRILAGTPNIVAAINVVVFGMLAALIADTLGASDTMDVAVGVIAALMALAAFCIFALRGISSARRAHHPRFPQPITAK